MQIQKSPYPTDFLLNNPVFTIRTSPNMVEGRKIDMHYSVTRLDVGAMVISTAHGTHTFEIKRDEDPEKKWEIKSGDTAEEIHAALERKVAHNYELNQYYTVNIRINNNAVRLRITAKEGLTGDFVNVTADGEVTELTMICTKRGTTQKPKENYRIMAQYLLEDGTKTPEMHIDDNNGTASIGTELLKAYLGKPDIPRADEMLEPAACGNQTLDAKLLYAEVVNGETGTVKISDPVTLLNARITKEDFDNNMPDWKSNQDMKMWKLKTTTIYGQDNGDTIHTDTETEQYLYLYTTKDRDETVMIKAEVETAEQTHIYGREAVLKRGKVSRIACGWEAVMGFVGLRPETKPLRWTIRISTAEIDIRRSFNVRPRPYGAVTALLLNRCRLYESLVFEETAEETQREGETVETGTGTAYLTHKRRDTVTLRTGKRTAKEIALLRDALEQTDNLLLDPDGRHAWRITAAPDTLKLKDDGADLLEAEVKATRCERIDRLATQNPPDRAVGDMKDIREATTTIG